MSSNSNSEVERLTAELERRRAKKALRNLGTLDNNSASVPKFSEEEAREKALEQNTMYKLETRAPSRASSRASSPSQSQASRRTRGELINKYRRNLANFNTRRASGTLGKSRTHTVNQRRAILQAKLNSQIAANALARAKSAAKNDLKRSQSVARNEAARARTAERERAAAELNAQRREQKAKKAANKAAGIVVPKAPKPSANEDAAAIRAKFEANARALKLKFEETTRAMKAEMDAKIAKDAARAARKEELARQLAAVQAVRNQEKAQASSAKAAKEHADLEAKCAAIGWSKK